MKTTLALLIFLCVFTLPTFAELTDADLNKIRLIVKEEVNREIATSEKQIKEYIDLKIEGVNKQFESVNKQFESVDKQFESVDKQFESVNRQITLLTNVVYGLVALIVAAIAIPQIILAWRSGKYNAQEKINQELRAEIETLKQQQIIRP